VRKNRLFFDRKAPKKGPFLSKKYFCDFSVIWQHFPAFFATRWIVLANRAQPSC